MTVLEPKHPFDDLYKTEAIPSSHAAYLNIEGLNSYFKDSPVCLDLAYFQPKNNFIVISGSSLHFLNDAVNSLVKNASITHFKFVERRPRDNKIL